MAARTTTSASVAARHWRGAAVMTAGAAAAVCVGLAVKEASLTLETPMVVFLRYAMALVVLAPLWWLRRRDIVVSPHFKVHVLRGLATTLSVGLYFYTVATLPLSAAIAIQFTAPLFIPPLAMLLLGERTGVLPYAGVVLAVTGAVTTAGPLDGATAVVPVAVGLSSAIICALMNVHAKTMLSGGESLVTIAFWFTLVGTLGSGAFVLATGSWQEPGVEVLGFMALGGGLASLSQVFVLGAFRDLSAAAFATLKLMPIPLGALTAYLFFGETPAGHVLAGILLIAAGIVATQAQPTMGRRAGCREEEPEETRPRDALSSVRRRSPRRPRRLLAQAPA